MMFLNIKVVVLNRQEFFVIIFFLICSDFIWVQYIFVFLKLRKYSQYAKWTLNDIRGTFNETFLG